MSAKGVESVPACSKLFEKLGLIVQFGEIKDGFIINSCYKESNVKGINRNIFINENTNLKIPEDCFRLFKNLNLFKVVNKHGSQIEVLEDGEKLFENRDKMEYWNHLIIDKVKRIYKIQIKAVLTVLQELISKNNKVIKNDLKTKFYKDFKSNRIFYYNGRERTESNMKNKCDVIITLLVELKILSERKSSKNKKIIILELNYENFNKFLPEFKLELSSRSESSKENIIWDYMTFIKIFLGVYEQLPEVMAWESLKGVDYNDFKTECLKKLLIEKKIENASKFFDIIFKEMKIKYKKYIKTIKSRKDQRIRVFLRNVNIENYHSPPKSYSAL